MTDFHTRLAEIERLFGLWKHQCSGGEECRYHEAAHELLTALREAEQETYMADIDRKLLQQRVVELEGLELDQINGAAWIERCRIAEQRVEGLEAPCYCCRQGGCGSACRCWERVCQERQKNEAALRGPYPTTIDRFEERLWE